MERWRADAPVESEGRKRWTAWIVTWVAYATGYLGRKGFGVAKKTIEGDLGIGRATLATIDTGYLVLYAVGQFSNGLLADRAGARRLVGWGLVFSAALCALAGASKGAALLFIAFSLNGYAQSAGWPGTTRSMAEWTTPENRRRVMGYWATCYQFGGIAASAGAAWLLRFGWRQVFFAPAAVLAVVGILVLALLSPGPGAPDLELGRKQSAEDASERKLAMKAALRSPTLWCFGASYFAIKLIRYSLLFWLPYYLSDALHYSASAAGYLSTAFEVGGVVGVVAAGLATDRFRGLSRTLLSSVLLVGLCLVIVLYTKLAPLGTGANALGLALVGACLFAPDSLLSGAVAQDAGGPLAAATATGLVNGVGSVGAILQGAINSWVSTAFGWPAVFFVFMVFALLGALALVPTFRRDGAP